MDGAELWGLLVVLWSALSLGAIGCAAQVSGQPQTPYVALHGPLVIAHRGGSLEAPENTLAAVQHGIDVGADWIEIDVTLSKDGELVVIHDDTLDRTTDGAGPIGDKTLAEIRRLRAGRPTWSEQQQAQLAAFEVIPPTFGDTYAEEKIPTLEEVLAVPEARLMIELKGVEERYVRDLARGVVRAIRGANAYNRVIVGSFRVDLLWAVYDLEPSLPLIGIAENDQEIADVLALPLTALGVRIDWVSEAVKRAPAGVAVWGWTAYNPAMADAVVAQGGHGVITDAPKAVLEHFRPSDTSPYLNGD